MTDKKEAAAAQKGNSPVGIVTYCHVWKPFAFPAKPGQTQKEPEFSLLLVVPKDADMSRLKEICRVAAYGKFGEEKVKKMIKAKKFQMPWRDASEYEENGPPFDQDDGAIMIKAHSNTQPGIVDHNKEEILDPTEFYSGCLARMSVYAHAYDTMGNQGVTLLLNNIQKTGVSKWKKLAGKANAADDFDKTEREGEEEDNDDDDSPF